MKIRSIHNETHVFIFDLTKMLKIMNKHFKKVLIVWHSIAYYCKTFKLNNFSHVLLSAFFSLSNQLSLHTSVHVRIQQTLQRVMGLK